jgi:Mor family transcriptional regulator
MGALCGGLGSAPGDVFLATTADWITETVCRALDATPDAAQGTTAQGTTAQATGGKKRNSDAFFLDLVKITAATAAERLGATPDEGEDLGKEVAAQLVDVWMGCSLYFAKPQGDMQARDKAIVQEYQAGADILSLVRKYGLSDNRIRQILGLGAKAQQAQ